MTFTLDLDLLATNHACLAETDELPFLGESPGRGIDELVSRFSDCIHSSDSADILIYPLIYESDADGVLIVVRNEFHKPGLAGTPADWDDYASHEMLHGDLTLEQVTEILQAVVDEANRIKVSNR